MKQVPEVSWKGKKDLVLLFRILYFVVDVLHIPMQTWIRIWMTITVYCTVYSMRIRNTDPGNMGPRRGTFIPKRSSKLINTLRAFTHPESPQTKNMYHWMNNYIFLKKSFFHKEKCFCLEELRRRLL